LKEQIPKLKAMNNTDKKNAQLSQVADLMNTLSDMQLKMSRVKAMFPNYHQQLQQTYNQLIMQAKRNNVLPPWMTA
jgi:molecular chaperone GrpE (heat shock protein)